MFSSKRERSGTELLPEPGQVVSERLDMLASTVSATAASLAKTNGELATLRRSLENGLTHVDTVVGEMRSRSGGDDVRALEKRVAELAAERSRTGDARRLDDLSAKVALLAQRVDTLASAVATTASSVAGRDGEVAALRRQLDEGSQGPAVDDALLRRIEEVAAASASTSMRLESHGAQIAALESRDDGVDEQLAELARRMDTTEQERTALASSVADAAALRWREIERALGALAERLDTVEERGTALSSELARATSLWPAALRSLESRVAELASGPRPAAVDRPQPDADTQVLDALRTLEQRLQRADEAAREEREVVLERLEQITGRLDTKPGDLHPAGAEIVPFRTDL